MAQQQMSEEQLKELQEKIKHMSPEELKEFQKKQCIFCHIVAGKVQSKKIFEDDKCIAILDINPSNPGHVLLLPKEHYSIMPQVPEGEISHLFMIARTISNAALRSLGVQGTNIVVQNGIAAGQKAQHFMVHIIPRKERDGINFELPQREIPENELESIRKKLESRFGVVEEAKPKPKIQDLIKPKKEEIVEAEFKEEQETETNKKSKDFEEKPKETKKRKEQKQEKKDETPKKKQSAASLDEIAKILGVK